MRISDEEIQSGQLTPQTLGLVVRQMRDLGFVILEQVIKPSTVNRVYEAFLSLFKPHIEKPEVRERVEAGNKYVRLPLPFTPPFNDESICANPIAVQVMEAMMDEVTCNFFYSLTTLQGTTPQHTHIDMMRYLFPGFPVALPPWSLNVNIPMIDFTEDNGSTEVWPGTHLQPIDDSLGERSKSLASVRLNARVGDLVLRDPRVWHRGMPNKTTAIRTIIQLIYCRPWYRLPVPPLDLQPGWSDPLSDRARRIFSNDVITPQ